MTDYLLLCESSAWQEIRVQRKNAENKQFVEVLVN